MTGRTETIWDVLNPRWVRTFTIDPETRKNERFRVSVFDRDTKSRELDQQERIGSIEFSVNDLLICGYNGKKMSLERADNKKIKDPGTVRVIGELFKADDEDHELVIETCKFKNASSLGKLASRPYLVISRQRPNNAWAPILRSEPKQKGNDDQEIICRATIRKYSTWKSGSWEDTSLLIELRSHHSASEHTVIGTAETNMGSLRRKALGTVMCLRLGNATVGGLSITRASVGEGYSNFYLEATFHNGPSFGKRLSNGPSFGKMLSL